MTPNEGSPQKWLKNLSRFSHKKTQLTPRQIMKWLGHSRYNLELLNASAKIDIELQNLQKELNSLDLEFARGVI